MSVVKIGEVIWRPTEHRVVIALNRFDWEAAVGETPAFQRRRAALAVRPRSFLQVQESRLFRQGAGSQSPRRSNSPRPTRRVAWSRSPFPAAVHCGSKSNAWKPRWSISARSGRPPAAPSTRPSTARSRGPDPRLIRRDRGRLPFLPFRQLPDTRPRQQAPGGMSCCVQAGSARVVALALALSASAQHRASHPRSSRSSSVRRPAAFSIPMPASSASNMSKTLGRTIIIENKPGASGTIATQFVVDQPADGAIDLGRHPGLHRDQSERLSAICAGPSTISFRS